MPPEIQCELNHSKPCTVVETVQEIAKEVKAVHGAMLGGTFEHPEGIFHEMKKHRIALYGEDGKGGLVADMEDYKRIRAISKAVYVGIGVLATVFGPMIGKWLVSLFLMSVAKVAPH